jgi:hypothetical protein
MATSKGRGLVSRWLSMQRQSSHDLTTTERDVGLMQPEATARLEEAPNPTPTCGPPPRSRGSRSLGCTTVSGRTRTPRPGPHRRRRRAAGRQRQHGAGRSGLVAALPQSVELAAREAGSS